MKNGEGGKMSDLGKNFFYGRPIRSGLSSEDQIIIETRAGNDIAESQGRQLMVATKQTSEALNSQTGRLIEETARSRQETATHSEALRREIAESQMVTRGKLEGMIEAFDVASKEQIDAIQESGDESRGISYDRRRLGELIDSGYVDETEALALVRRGVIPRDVGELEVFNKLPEWKIRILTSGLVDSPNPIIERNLSSEEREFLRNFRRALRVPITQLSSLPVIARNRYIVPEVHNNLMKGFKEYRQGSVGTLYTLNDIDDKLAVSNRQGAEMVQIHRITAEIARKSLLVEEGILVATGDTAVSARNLVRLAEDGNALLRNGNAISGQIELNTRQIADNTNDIRTATVRTADYTSALCDLQIAFGDKMDEANRISLQQLVVDVAQYEKLQSIASSAEESVSLLIDLNELATEIADRAASIDSHLMAVGHKLSDLHITIKNIALVFSQKLTDIQSALNHHTQTTLAVAEEQRLRDLSPEKIIADEKYQNGMMLFKAGEIENAIPYFDEAAKKDPVNPEIYYRRAMCYIILDEPDLAENDLLRALNFIKIINLSEEKKIVLKTKVTLALSQLYYTKANLYNDQGEIDKRDSHMKMAINRTESLFKETPSNSEVIFSLAKYLAGHQLWEESSKYLVLLLEQYPEYVNKICYEPEFAPILPMFREVLGSQIKSPEDFYFKLSIDYIRENDVEAGLELIKRLIQYSPQILVQEKAFKREALESVKQRIIEMITEIIEDLNITRTSQCCFSLSSLALSYEASRGVVLKALRQGVGNSTTEQDAIRIREEIQHVAPDNYEDLISLLRRLFSIPIVIRETL